MFAFRNRALQQVNLSEKLPNVVAGASEASRRSHRPTIGYDLPHINVLELAGKQMLPLEPRAILELTLDNVIMDTPMTQFSSIVDILHFRDTTSPDATAFSIVDNKGRETRSWTWDHLFGRAEKIRQTILNKSTLRRGARVALVFRKSEILDFMAAFYGTMMAGMTAVPINVIEELAEMMYILRYTKSELALTTEHNYKALTRDLQNAHKGMDWPEGITWWKTDTLGGHWRSKRKHRDFSASIADHLWSQMEFDLPDLAYIEYTKSPNGELKGVAVSHRTILSQCHAIRYALESHPKRKSSGSHGENYDSLDSRAALSSMGTTRKGCHRRAMSGNSQTARKKDVTLSWLEPRQQVGLVLGGLLGVYRGNHTIFARSGIMEVPGAWETCAQRHQVTLALGDYEGVRELIRSCKGLKDAKRCRLPSLETFLIDTVMIHPMLDRRFASEFLAPLGITEPEKVVVPMSSLPEHGGMILSMRDHLMFPRDANLIDFGFEYDIPRTPALDLSAEHGLGDTEPQKRPRGHSTDSDTICYYLLDRGALGKNVIKVVATGEQAIQRAVERGVVLVGAFGYATPRATLAIVDPETTALCQPNRVGEIWIDSPSIAFGFWELPRHSQSIFHAIPLIVPVDTMVPEAYDPVPAGFLRTGLIGGLIEGRVVVFGLYEDRIQQPVLQDIKTHGIVQRYKYHYTTDLANTIMERITGFTSCVVFDIYVNNEHLPVVCAETPRHHSSDLQKLAEFVKRAMKDYHGLRPYCLAICPQGALPRAYKNGRRAIHPVLCSKMLELGRLPLLHLWTSVDGIVFNLAVGDDVRGGIWGAEAMAVRDAAFPAHTRMAQFSYGAHPMEALDDRSRINLTRFSSLAELLVWRVATYPDEIAFLGLDHQGKESKSITFRKFGMKIANYAQYIEKRGGFKAGDKVVLLFPNGIDFVAAIYAAWMLGLIPIPVPVPDPSRMREDIVMLMSLLTELRVSRVVGNSVTESIMKQKTAVTHMKAFIGARQDTALPTVLNVSKAPKVNKPLGKESGYSCPPKASLSKTVPAVVYPHYSTDMRRTLIKVSHKTLMAQCRAQKTQCRLNGKPIVSCWKNFAGMGLLLSCGLGIYAGAPTILIRYTDFLALPQIYLEAVERYGARDVVVNYTMLEQLFAVEDPQMLPRTFNFSAVRNFMILTEGRPRIELHRAVERWLCGHSSSSRMDRIRISGAFGHMAVPFVSARSYMNIEPARLHLSLRSLRHGLIEITTEEEDPTGIWIEDSGIPVCGTTVAVVNPETRELCHTGEIGEIWVMSEANVQAYASPISPLAVEASSNSTSSIMELQASRFNATIACGNGNNTPDGVNDSNGSLADDSGMRGYVRTGEIGFLWNFANDTFNNGQATSLLFVLGSIAETFEVNGLLHFPMDVEATIEKAHPNVAPGGSIVFQADQAVVCVVQVRQADATIMNLVFTLMNRIMEKHQFLPDVIAIVGEGALAINRYGEKQRGKMLSLFMSAKMPLLFIHYPRGEIPGQSRPHEGQRVRKSITIKMSNTTTATATPTRLPNLSPNASSVPSGASSPTSISSSFSLDEVTPTTAESKCRIKSRSVHSNRSSGVSSISGSLRSALSVRSFVGSMFQHGGKQQHEGSQSQGHGSHHANGNRTLHTPETSTKTSLMDLQGIHGSISESGLASFPSPASLSKKRHSEGSFPPPVSPITICTKPGTGGGGGGGGSEKGEEDGNDDSTLLSPPPSASTLASIDFNGKDREKAKGKEKAILTPLTPISPTHVQGFDG
ncbi:hypothetical protein B0O80DRAFT_492369 [Mortierella sp. GBAus27b]|nr:hypothetical protein B0O80DRAFT_492369 [Mortierella sp. GBAus27b]